MDDVTTLVGDKRRCSRLLKRVLCLFQSLQPSSENISRRRAKIEKKPKPNMSRNQNTVFLFCCEFIATEAVSIVLDVLVQCVESFLPARASWKTCYTPKGHCRDYINTLRIIGRWRGKLRWQSSHTLLILKTACVWCGSDMRLPEYYTLAGAKTILYE